MSEAEKARELARLREEGYKVNSRWFDDLRPANEPEWPWYGNDVY
jgi:hypothetical protein